MFKSLIDTLTTYSSSLPLEFMAFLGGFIEEFLPPLPIPPIMFFVGNFARIQAYPLITIFTLAIISASARTISAGLIYKIVDKLEDIFIIKFGVYFNLKPGQIESIGQRLGDGKANYLVLISLRAFPFIPSTFISIVSGIIRLPQRLFLISTFIGLLIRDSFFLYVGYMGTKTLRKFLYEANEISLTIKLFAIIIIIILLLSMHVK